MELNSGSDVTGTGDNPLNEFDSGTVVTASGLIAGVVEIATDGAGIGSIGIAEAATAATGAKATGSDVAAIIVPDFVPTVATVTSPLFGPAGV